MQLAANQINFSKMSDSDLRKTLRAFIVDLEERTARGEERGNEDDFLIVTSMTAELVGRMERLGVPEEKIKVFLEKFKAIVEDSING